MHDSLFLGHERNPEAGHHLIFIDLHWFCFWRAQHLLVYTQRHFHTRTVRINTCLYSHRAILLWLCWLWFGISPDKFYPYDKDNLAGKKNDLLTLALLLALFGFIITTLGGVIFESVIVKKFIAKSPLILKYYYWVFPFHVFFIVLFYPGGVFLERRR